MARKNKIQFTMVFTVPAEHVAEGDNLFKSHAAWMERTHHKNGEKALLIYDLSKSPEMEDPMKPDSKPTGRTHFILSEVYDSPAGLQDHWQQADENWDDFDNLKAWMGKGEFLLVNGAKIEHSLW